MGSFNRDGRGGGRSFGGGRGGVFTRDGFGGRKSFGRGGGRGDGNREMFKAICSNCGKEAQVPFRPTNGKPVYCSDCFEKFGPQRSEGGRLERPDFKPQRLSIHQEKPQVDKLYFKLEAIDIKIERILKLLESKTVPEIPTLNAQIPEVVKIKTPRIKKEVKKKTPKKK